MTDEQLIAELEAQRDLMVSVSTGGPRIQSVNRQYVERRTRILAELRPRRLDDPNPHADLWAWHGRWSSGDMADYKSRRTYVASLYNPLVDRIRSGTGAMGAELFDEPTGWPRVDRGVEETEFELVCALVAEPLFQRSIPAFQVSIGDEEKPVHILVSQPRHQHPPELKSLGAFQGQPGGPEEEKHQPDQNQRDQRHADQNTTFEAAHFVTPVLSAPQSAFA